MVAVRFLIARATVKGTWVTKQRGADGQGYVISEP